MLESITCFFRANVEGMKEDPEENAEVNITCPYSPQTIKKRKKKYTFGKLMIDERKYNTCF